MSIKRDHDDFDDNNHDARSEQEPQRAKKHKKMREHQNAAIDPTWGQKYVFSGTKQETTIPDGEESEFEDDADAMAYLSAVRQEASGIPHLLVAPKRVIGPQLPTSLQDEPEDDSEAEEEAEPEVDRSMYYNGTGDARGWYEDGAYIARAEVSSNTGEDEEPQVHVGQQDLSTPVTLQSLQSAYYFSQVRHFERWRRLLRRTVPPHLSSRLRADHPTCAAPFGPSSSATTNLWSRILRTTDPCPVQVALMSKDSVLRILRVLLGGKFLRRGYPMAERTSRWIWSLLARLPDQWELSHTEIGWIRDIGKRAVLLGRSLAEMAALREELEEGALGVNEAVDGSSNDGELLAADEEIEEADSVGPEDTKETDSAVDQVAAIQQVQTNSKLSGLLSAADGESHVDEVQDSDAPMELSSDEGEVDQSPAPEQSQSLEAVKLRLLAELDPAEPDVDDIETETTRALEQSRINMRATLNMILTVAGEFYGQRDLLEFRDPFVGM